MVTIREVRLVFDEAFGLWPCLFLSVMGVVTNILCYAVFARQGFRESATIALTAITIMDLLKCVVSCAHRVYGILQLWDNVLATNWLRCTYMLNLHTQNVATTLANVFTLYVTFERCLCLCVPFKVKLLVTRKVTLVSLVISTILVVGTMFPPTLSYGIIWVVDRRFNITVAQYAITDIYDNLSLINTYTNIAILVWALTTFVVINIFTGIIIVRLQQLGKFRSEHSSASNTTTKLKVLQSKTMKPQNRSKTVQDKIIKEKLPSSEKKGQNEQLDLSPDLSRKDKKDRDLALGEDTPQAVAQTDVSPSKAAVPKPKLPTRDAQLVRLLLLVVLMYIISIIPKIVLSVSRTAEPEFNIYRRYEDIYLMVVDVMMAIDFVNSSTNFFIFIAMSSHFRKTYGELWQSCRKKA